MVKMLLDGGMGHLLKEWGVRTEGLPYEQQFLGGVLANSRDPDLVKRAHRCYIAAGSRIITTNNFAATHHNLAKVQMQAAATEIVQVIFKHFPEQPKLSNDDALQSVVSKFAQQMDTFT
jgi:methionine synthase I (cobalamin-dependent)